MRPENRLGGLVGFSSILHLHWMAFVVEALRRARAFCIPLNCEARPSQIDISYRN